MRICFVRLSALGDIVMCLPLLRTLQKNFPKSEITWIVGKPFAPILEKLEGVRVIPIPKIKSFSDWQGVRALLKPYQFDALLACQASFSANIIYPCIKAKRKIGYDRERSKDFHGLFVGERIPFQREHTVEGFLRFAKALGASEMSFDGRVPLGGDEKVHVTGDYFAVNPCSSKREKDWDYAHYKGVIEYVRKEFGFTPVLTGGGGDRAVCEQIAAETGALNLCGKTTLLELTTLLKRAKFLLSPDTGPAHIASAMGTPVIGLFAPTSPILTGPYFSQEYIIDKHPEVLSRFSTSKKNWNVRIYHDKAMQLITPEEVYKKISLIYYKK